MTHVPAESRYADHYQYDTVGEVISWAALAVTVVLLLGAAALTLAVRARFLKVFEDFDAELPRLTTMLLSVPPSLYLLGALVVAALLIVKEVLLGQTAVRLTVNVAVGLLALGWAGLFILAVWIPLDHLLQVIAQ